MAANAVAAVLVAVVLRANADVFSACHTASLSFLGFLALHNYNGNGDGNVLVAFSHWYFDLPLHIYTIRLCPFIVKG